MTKVTKLNKMLKLWDDASDVLDIFDADELIQALREQLEIKQSTIDELRKELQDARYSIGKYQNFMDKF